MTTTINVEMVNPFLFFFPTFTGSDVSGWLKWQLITVLGRCHNINACQKGNSHQTPPIKNHLPYLPVMLTQDYSPNQHVAQWKGHSHKESSPGIEQLEGQALTPKKSTTPFRPVRNQNSHKLLCGYHPLDSLSLCLTINNILHTKLIHEKLFAPLWLNQPQIATKEQAPQYGPAAREKTKHPTQRFHCLAKPSTSNS